MYEQNALYFVKHSDLEAKKFNQNLPKNCSKSTEMATAVCKFSKIFWGSMPPDPPRAFFILNMLSNSAGKNYA